MIVAELETGVPIKTLWSLSHRISEEVVSPGRVVVELADRVTPADRVFELNWTLVQNQAPSAMAFSEVVGPWRYVQALIVPPASDQVAGFARDVTFLIDVSGSMAGRSLAQAKEALRRLLSHSGVVGADGVRINVIAFNDTPRALFQSAQPASTDVLREAIEFVSGLRASGGTEMIAALEFTMRRQLADEASRIRQIILLTDAAVSREEALMASVERSAGHTRIFPVGIGSAPNADLIAELAEVTNGLHLHISDVDEIAAKVSRLGQAISAPNVRDVAVHWGPSQSGQAAKSPDEMLPNQLPDLYPGRPIWLVARVGRDTANASVSGRMLDREWAEDIVLDLAESPTVPGTHKLWAQAKVRKLLRQKRTSPRSEQTALRRDIAVLGIEHQILTPFTSFVGVERRAVSSNPDADPLRRVVLDPGTPASALKASNLSALPMPRTATGWWIDVRNALAVILAGAFLARVFRRSIGVTDA
jgi:Ca-activated chloride channel family protein